MATPEQEPAEHRDPFENLRLDEGFVRAARFIEPSAAERGRSADRKDPGRCQVVPAPRRMAPGMHRMVWAPGPGRRRRRATRVVAFLAVLAGVISIVVALRHSSSRVAGTVASTAAGVPSNSPATAPLAAHSSSGSVVNPALLSSVAAGDCVTWDVRNPAGSLGARRIPCDQPHLAEVIRVVSLSWRLPDTDWPSVSTMDSIAFTECSQAFNSYTAKAQPGLVPQLSAIEPGSDSWDSGVKTLACTAQLPKLAAITGHLGLVPTPA